MKKTTHVHILNKVISPLKGMSHEQQQKKIHQHGKKLDLLGSWVET